jgi:gliding motility-associated-like protein
LPRWLAPVVFAALLLATAVAFVQAQLVKKNNLLLDRVRGARAFSPNGDGRHDLAWIQFRLTRPDRADVEIVDRDGHIVRTLARDRSLRPYHYWIFTWDGKTDGGRPAPAADYRPRVVLRRQDRHLLLHKTIHLYRVPPIGRAP